VKSEEDKREQTQQRIDELVIRCRRLGHEVTFKYCHTQEGASICPSIRNCWWERVDIDAWLENNLDSDTIDKLRAGRAATPRLNRILDIINELGSD